MRNIARTITLFTNRSAMICDDFGAPVRGIEGAVGPYGVNPHMARELCAEATEFRLSKFGEWSVTITRIEMEYLLGLRTRERDLAECGRLVGVEQE
jgi:hypothetical protein